MKLNEIIDKNDNSIKFSKTIDPNWRKLINLCEYGFTITNDISSNKGENILKRKAFIIKQYKKEKCSGTVVTKDDTVLNTELEKLCARNLIFESKASIMLPWLTFYVDLKNEKSIESYNKSASSTSCLITRSPCAQINFEESGYSLTDEFINDIESAIDSNLTDDEKFDRLKKIIEKYGQFYSKKIFFGGIIIKPSECNKDQSNYNHSQY